MLATDITIDAGGTLTLTNQGNGIIDGASAGVGNLVFDGNYDTDSAIGGTFSLASVTVNAGSTLTLDQTLNAGTLTIGGVVSKASADTLTATTTINDGGLMLVMMGFNHTGNLTVGGGTSGTLNLTNSVVNVNGTFDLQAGATLRTTVNSGATDDAGRITVTGATTVSANAIVDVVVSAQMQLLKTVLPTRLLMDQVGAVAWLCL